MPEQAVTKCAGLITQYNPLTVREGALIQADNAVVRREDTVENRRGYAQYATLSSEPDQLFNYNGRILSHHGTTISADNGSGTFNAYIGSFTAPIDLTTTGNVSNGSTTVANLATISGVRRGQIVSGTGIPAGTYILSIAGTSIVLSQAGTATNTGVTLTFSSRKIYSQEANSNVYITTTNGIRVLQDVTPPISITANTHSNNVLDNLSSTVGVLPGKIISGSGIPANTYVASILGTTVTMSANASSSLTGTAITITSTSRQAGVPRALAPSLSLVSGSTFDDNTQVAYRIILQRTDENQNVLNSYPSQREWIANSSGGAKNIQLICYLPSAARAGDVVQIYRTPIVTYNPSTGADEAGDEEALVFQQTLAQSDILTGSLTVTDTVEDALLGATIYTAPSQEGIGQANAEPPLAKDVAFYKNFMFYGNTETKQILYVNLISVENLYNSGTYGKTVIIAGTTYTSAATETISTGHFATVSTGVPAVDIDNAARSLIRVINGYSSNTLVYAYYLTTPDTLPGQIAIEARTLGSAAFAIQVGSSGTAGDFFPAPPVSPNTTTESTSSNQVNKNGLYVSKEQELEAVPLTQIYYVGPANSEILRLEPLRDSLIIIKEDGIYRLVGETVQSFTITPLDLTVACQAINTVATLANNVQMLSNQGVVSIGDTGVEVISRPIEPEILPLLTYANLSTFSYATGYESEREYIISTIGSAGDTAATQIYVFNIFTRAWTRWTFATTSMVVLKGRDILFLTKNGQSKVFMERKGFNNSDYADPVLAIVINSISGSTINFTLASDTPVAGWVIEQGITQIKISSIQADASTWNAVMAEVPPSSWTTGAALIYPAINMQVEWDAFTAGAPGYLKQLQRVAILTDDIGSNDSVSSLFATFRTDLSRNMESTEIFSDAEGWGGPWGTIPWGGIAETFSYPAWPPPRKSYFRTYNFGVIHQNALEKCSVSGFATTFIPVSERTNK